jgi:hypothetical protein
MTEKNLFKLMNNSVFSKTVEDVEKHIDFQLVTDKTKLNKLVAKPNFDRNVIFDENLVAIHMKKIQMVYNKPIYFGMCILELSKTLMFEFHYDYIKPKYGDKAKLLGMDTDSLMNEIETNEFCADTKDDVERRFDTFEYLEDHPAALAPQLGGVGFTVRCNKKVIGLMKDESAGTEISEFAGLRAECYAMKVEHSDRH